MLSVFVVLTFSVLFLLNFFVFVFVFLVENSDSGKTADGDGG